MSSKQCNGITAKGVRCICLTRNETGLCGKHHKFQTSPFHINGSSIYYGIPVEVRKELLASMKCQQPTGVEQTHHLDYEAKLVWLEREEIKRRAGIVSKEHNRRLFQIFENGGTCKLIIPYLGDKKCTPMEID